MLQKITKKLDDYQQLQTFRWNFMAFQISCIEKTLNDISIVGYKFNNCSAILGGAIYIFSDVDTSLVTIKKCVFKYNILLESRSNTLTGGSTMYLHVKKAITKCASSNLMLETMQSKLILIL